MIVFFFIYKIISDLYKRQNLEFYSSLLYGFRVFHPYQPKVLYLVFYLANYGIYVIKLKLTWFLVYINESVFIFIKLYKTLINRTMNFYLNKFNSISTDFEREIIKTQQKFLHSKSAENKALVVWGSNLGYTLGLKRYTPLIRSMVQIPYYQLSVIIGLLLSNGSININTGKGLNRAKLNARIEFTQSFDKFPYFPPEPLGEGRTVFNALSNFCAGLPKEAVRKRNGITNYSIRFCSRAFPCLTELHKLFYINGVKVIPPLP
jgi:hypothetical protein